MSELRNRAYGDGGAPSGALERRQADLRGQVQRMESAFALALPRGASAAQLVRDSLTVLSANPGLAGCEPMTVLGGLMTMAQLGLRPGVLGHGWLIPFKGKAQLVIGYQGLLELAHRSGQIASIQAHVVHEADAFSYAFGLNERLDHTPAAGARGEATHYYCVVKSQSGGVYWDVITRAEAEEHRDRFAMAKSRDGRVVGPWRDHFDSMALKTVIKRVLKMAPRSTEIATALGADESAQVHPGLMAGMGPVEASAADLPADPAPGAPAAPVWDDPEGWDEAAGDMDGAEAAGEGL